MDTEDGINVKLETERGYNAILNFGHGALQNLNFGGRVRGYTGDTPHPLQESVFSINASEGAGG